MNIEAMSAWIWLTTSFGTDPARMFESIGFLTDTTTRFDVVECPTAVAAGCRRARLAFLARRTITPGDAATPDGEVLMKFISTRIITADVNRLVEFYEAVTQVSAVWGNELFAEIPTPVGTLAIGSDKTVPLFGAGSAEPAANRTAILEFIVEDVDAEYGRLRDRVGEVVTEPTTMPWGNRALLFRDPDGNLVNLFTPVTDDARAKFGV